MPEASADVKQEAEVPSMPEPAAVPEPELAVREREQADAEKTLRARLAEEEAARLQQQAEAARRQEEEAARQRALAREEAARREEAERRTLEDERRKTEEASRLAALALQQQQEEARRRESEEAARRAMELEEKQRAELQRLQAERMQREAMELQARKLAEAAEAARQQALARERERQSEELAARRRAEVEAANVPRREPELVLGDSPAPGARSNALPRDVGGGLASRALEQARRADTLRNDAPALRQPESATDQPRRRSILGGKDVDVGVMMYVDGWRLKIERNGSIMYPRAAAELAHRDPVVTVAVRSDGSVENVVIHQSSGRPELDEAVYRIVRMNARYSAFPPELARRFDVIEIRRVWNFDERLRIMEEVR
ncbi:hypothetical protein AYR66_17905 [Noviherbaspirillum denitrificans]|uniref:TonB C-terminal domain-containing protein n=1 Tax=Noviherbaspirillum denitrificans TaxID=1968433 RepID=A0A254TEK9_9BURK|nr:hypothetical protein AYR66_17905 [Noviherbaspirillum denitrificans]